MEQTEVEAYNYQTKKQNSKTHSTISIDQPKFNKTRISTKPIKKSIFNQNGASNGGAIYNKGELTMIESIFNQNEADGGGAICNRSELSIVKSTFDQNNGWWGGAISNCGVLSIKKSVFNLNKGGFYSGVIDNQFGKEFSMEDCKFSGNECSDVFL